MSEYITGISVPTKSHYSHTNLLGINPLYSEDIHQSYFLMRLKKTTESEK